jgi:hypothetical protein
MTPRDLICFVFDRAGVSINEDLGHASHVDGPAGKGEGLLCGRRSVQEAYAAGGECAILINVSMMAARGFWIMRDKAGAG